MLPLIPQDKANHVIYGVLVYAMGAALAGPVVAMVAVVLVGAVKEFYDSATGRGTPDVGDFFATAAGGLAGLACAFIGL